MNDSRSFPLLFSAITITALDREFISLMPVPKRRGERQKSPLTKQQRKRRAAAKRAKISRRINRGK